MSARSDAPEELPSASVVFSGVAMHMFERGDRAGHRNEWRIVRATTDRVVFAMRRPPHARLDRFVEEPSVQIAVNGGFFEADESPSGWLLTGGHELAPANPPGGSGFFVVQHDRARIEIAGDASAQGPDFAVQCGPRLIEPGGVLGIVRDDGKRAARTAICLRERGSETNIVVVTARNSDRDGPTLYELAEQLARPLLPGDSSGCEAALNLDGGPSTGLYWRDHPAQSHRPFGRVPLALVLTPRE